MKLLSDKGQKKGEHYWKEKYWEDNNIEVIKAPLPVGDYIILDDKVQDVLDRKAARGIPVKKMDFLGSYKVAVDTKKDIQELIGDICGKQHERFRDECILAQNNGIKLYILVENEFVLITDGTKIAKKQRIQSPYIGNLNQLHKYINPRLFIMSQGKQKYPKATKGITLKKACMTMTEKYGVEFIFCHGRDAGWATIELLEGRYSEDEKTKREKEFSSTNGVFDSFLL